MELTNWTLPSELIVKKISGRDEFEVFRNYISEVKQEDLLRILSHCFDETTLEMKDDVKAAEIRLKGNIKYTSNNFRESRALYTKSLRFATYKGKEYAFALANRSAVNLALEDYQGCIQDINFCLDANYPEEAKPKVMIWKAKCYQKLGDVARMRKVLIDVLYFIQNSPALTSESADEYKRQVQQLLVVEVGEKPAEEERFDLLPAMDKNPTFLNASSSIALKYDERKGCHVVAKKDIARGEVLFVEKSYSFAMYEARLETNNLVEGMREGVDAFLIMDQVCQNCLVKVPNPIPCKTCVRRLYCSKNCRDYAWLEFHQWECLSVQANYYCSHAGNLSLITVLRAVYNGFSTTKKTAEELVDNYGNPDDNYPYVSNLPFPLDKIPQVSMMSLAAIAALRVTYLKVKTDFFGFARRMSADAHESEQDLMYKVGGLLIRHGHDLYSNSLDVKVENIEKPSSLNLSSIAKAICPSVATMKHSCTPNTTYYFVRDVVVVKALQDIKANEEIYYNHTGICMIDKKREFRQNLVNNALHLTCQCQLCTNPLLNLEARDSYMCIKCKSPAICLNEDQLDVINEYLCLNCNHKFVLTEDVVNRETAAVEYLVWFKMAQNIEDANSCLKILQTIFPVTHYAFACVYRNILECYISRKDIMCLIKAAKQLVILCRERYGEFSLCCGWSCYEFSDAAVNILIDPESPLLNILELQSAMKDIINFVHDAEVIFRLQYPPFLSRLQGLESKLGSRIGSTTFCNCNQNARRDLKKNV